MSPFDTLIAASAPILALYLRNALVVSDDGGSAAVTYCLLSLGFSLIAFIAFGIHAAIPRYLTVADLIGLAAAVLTAELMTCLVLFTFTRLDGVPRSVPAIHALIVGAGLLGVRAIVHHRDWRRTANDPSVEPQHVIIVGLNDLSVLFMKFLRATGDRERKVIGLLDEKPHWFGRSVNKVPVFGPPAHLDSLVEEFAAHGVGTDYVVIGVEARELSPPSLEEIRRVCDARNLELVFVPEFFTLNLTRDTVPLPEVAASRQRAVEPKAGMAIEPSAYFRSRRTVDFIAALVLAIMLMPFWMIGAIIALVDVGPPILFWQQRLGLGGRTFQLYKLRTLRPAFGPDGRRLSEERRLSRVGKFLRQTRIDELPQLWNVLSGDMAVIGPRPLLPRDQPPNPLVRLAVRPGITGWAQVNGGALLSPVEKDNLDSWYIANASVWLDLRVIAMTLLSLARGDRRSDTALSMARGGGSAIRISSRFAITRGDRPTTGKKARRRDASAMIAKRAHDGFEIADGD